MHIDTFYTYTHIHIYLGGRCVSVHLAQKASRTAQGFNVLAIGVHNGHGDQQNDVFFDASRLIKHRPWGAKVVLFGDLNCDQLPLHECDPFHADPGRLQHHLVERGRLSSICERFKLQVEVPTEVCSGPGGPFGDVCIVAPITRIPLGLSSETVRPSLLDYCAAAPDLVFGCRLHWKGTPADHALLEFSIRTGQVAVCGRKSVWKCRNEDRCVEWIRTHFDSMRSSEDVHAVASSCQRLWGDEDTCRVRRERRLPFRIRELYRRIASEPIEQGRLELQKRVWAERKAWVKEWRNRRLA